MPQRLRPLLGAALLLLSIRTAPVLASALSPLPPPKGADATPEHPTVSPEAFLEDVRAQAPWAILAHISPGMVRIIDATRPGLPEVVAVSNPSKLPIVAASFEHLAGGGITLKTTLPLEGGRVQLPALPWQPQGSQLRAGAPQAWIEASTFISLMAEPSLTQAQAQIEAEGISPKLSPALGRCLEDDRPSSARAFCLWLLSERGASLPEDLALALVQSGDAALVQGVLWSLYISDALSAVLSPSLPAPEALSKAPPLSPIILKKALESGDPLSQSIGAHLARVRGAAGLAPTLRGELAFASTDAPLAPVSVHGRSAALLSPQEAMTWALGTLDGSQEGAELLYLLLSEEDPKVAFAALRGLERQDDPALVPALDALIQNGDEAHVLMAIEALGRSRQGLGAIPLIRVVQDPERPLSHRKRAISALGMSRSEDGVALLESLLVGADDILSFPAALALGDLAKPAAFSHLCYALKDPAKVDASLEVLAALGPSRRLRACAKRLDRSSLLPGQAAQFEAAIALHAGLEEAPDIHNYLSQLITLGARGDALDQEPSGKSYELEWALGVVRSRHLVDLADDLRRALGLWRAQGGEQRVGLSMVRALWSLQVPLKPWELELIHAYFDGLPGPYHGLGEGVAQR